MKPTADVEFVSASKTYGDFKAVDDVSFDIRAGEFFSMLGPSGSGKTTCLRLVAGFLDVTSGKVLLEGQDVKGIPPYKRNVNTVFQDYALFPHMTIAENIGYGLLIRKVPKQEIRKKVEEMLEMVRLPNVSNRKPSELSGGQKQRIALARALINQPKVLLLDEPLGALDLKLREEMQIELKAIQKRVGITFIFVTHDQEEALSMSDRIAIFNKGKVEQIGTPEEVYDKPNSEFIANFVGISNLLSGEEAREAVGKSGTLLVRPEHLSVVTDSAKGSSPRVSAKFKNRVYSGATTRLLFETKKGSRIILFDKDTQSRFTSEQEVILTWDPSKMHILPESKV